jgi:hypothetical protein
MCGHFTLYRRLEIIVLNPAKSNFEIAKIILRASPDTDPEIALRRAQYSYHIRGQYKFTTETANIDSSSIGKG